METTIPDPTPKHRNPAVVILAIALVVAVTVAGWALATRSSEPADQTSGMDSGDQWLCDGLQLAKGDTQMTLGPFVIGSDWVADPELKGIIREGWEAWQDDNGNLVLAAAVKARDRCEALGA